MKKTLALVLAVLMLVSVCAFGASAEAGKKKETVFEVPYGTPTIDGTIDAIWNTVTPQKLNQQKVRYSSNNSSYSTVNLADYVASGAIADKAQFRVLWDETYVYFLVEVKDSTMITVDQAKANMKDWHLHDGVGYAFGKDFTNTNADNDNRTYCHIWAQEILANHTSDNAEMWICGSSAEFAAAGSNQNTPTKDFDKNYRCVITADGYRIESRAKLSASRAVSNLELKAGTELPFDMWVNENLKTDASANRTFLYTWADPDAASSNNNTTKGTLKLLAKPAPVVAGWTLFNGKDAALEASGSDAKLTSKGNYGGSTTADVTAAFMKTDKVDIKKGITFDVKSMSGLADGTKDAWFAISIMSSASVFDALKKTNPATGVTILGQCASNLQRFAPHTIKAGTFSNFATDAKFKNFLADSSAIIGNNDTVLNFKIKYDETAAQYVILVNDIPMETGDNAKKLSDAIASALDAEGKAYITFAMQHAESKTTTAVVSAVKTLSGDPVGPTPVTGDNTAIFALFAVVAVLGSAYVVVRKVRG